MSVKIMGAVWDADLPRDEKFILLSYADHAAHDGTGIYPSVGRTAWKTGYHRRSVQTITKKLVTRRILIPDGKGWNDTNRYRLDVMALPQREGYKRGANSAPCKKQQEGVQKTAKGSANSAPNPLLNRQESSLVEDDIPAAPSPSPKKEPPKLAPDTWQSRKMFERLGANAALKGRRGPQNFKTKECKEKFDKATEILGQEFDKALQAALEQGIMSVIRTTNYVAKWAANMQKQSRPQHHTVGA